MAILSAILVILGLSLFEGVSSIDNAVINAEVLSGMGERGRRWFLLWGLLFAVVVVRGVLPWLIVWLSTPSLGPLGSLTATFTSDPRAAAAIAASSPLLLLGGGVFLLFLFFHWLFLEDKEYGLRGEQFFLSQSAWFYATVSLFLTAIIWFALQRDSMLAFAAVVGSTAFFVIHGFRRQMEEEGRKLVGGTRSDLSKLLYLEALDATFSIDGVLGAFAFTFSIPLIILGNGFGALILRQLTIGNIARIKTYRYLKNGAMYSILGLSLIMLSNGFGVHIPEWLSPIATAGVVGYFFWKSKREIKNRVRVRDRG